MQCHRYRNGKVKDSYSGVSSNLNPVTGSIPYSRKRCRDGSTKSYVYLSIPAAVTRRPAPTGERPRRFDCHCSAAAYNEQRHDVSLHVSLPNTYSARNVGLQNVLSVSSRTPATKKTVCQRKQKFGHVFLWMSASASLDAL